MYSIKCQECGKVMWGHTERQTRYMLAQHKLKHFTEREEALLKLEKRKKEEQETDSY